jgi:seryl-tRNA synthetase
MKNQKEIELIKQIKELEKQYKIESKKFNSFCIAQDKLQNKLDKDYNKSLQAICEQTDKAETPVYELQYKIDELKMELKTIIKTEVPQKQIDEAIDLLKKCGYTVY